MIATYKKIVRFLHIYLTLFGLILLLFFSITGFMLNHENWFSNDNSHTIEAKGSIPLEMIRDKDKLEIVEYLRSHYRILGALSTYEMQEEQLRIVFKGPGRQSDVTVSAEGEVIVINEVHGWSGVIMDLHRGSETGTAWKRIIDAASILLFLSSISGFCLWFSLSRRNQWGILVLCCSVLIAFAVYYFTVP